MEKKEEKGKEDDSQEKKKNKIMTLISIMEVCLSMTIAMDKKAYRNINLSFIVGKILFVYVTNWILCETKFVWRSI